MKRMEHLKQLVGQPVMSFEQLKLAREELQEELDSVSSELEESTRSFGELDEVREDAATLMEAADLMERSNSRAAHEAFQSVMLHHLAKYDVQLPAMENENPQEDPANKESTSKAAEANASLLGRIIDALRKFLAKIVEFFKRALGLSKQKVEHAAEQNERAQSAVQSAVPKEKIKVSFANATEVQIGPGCAGWMAGFSYPEGIRLTKLITDYDIMLGRVVKAMKATDGSSNQAWLDTAKEVVAAAEAFAQRHFKDRLYHLTEKTHFELRSVRWIEVAADLHEKDPKSAMQLFGQGWRIQVENKTAAYQQEADVMLSVHDIQKIVRNGKSVMVTGKKLIDDLEYAQTAGTTLMWEVDSLLKQWRERKPVLGKRNLDFYAHSCSQILSGMVHDRAKINQQWLRSLTAIVGAFATVDRAALEIKQ